MISGDNELYERIRAIIRKFDKETIILKASLSDTSYPDVDKNPAYCVIQQNMLGNRRAVQRFPIVSYNEEEETFNTNTTVERNVLVQFDFFGKDEEETLNLATKFSQGLAYFLQEDPYEDMGLLGMVEPVENNSDILPNKNYRHRFTFRLKLCVVYGLTFSEDLITSVKGVEHKVIVR
jgi:hypothetical protein